MKSEQDKNTHMRKRRRLSNFPLIALFFLVLCIALQYILPMTTMARVPEISVNLCKKMPVIQTDSIRLTADIFSPTFELSLLARIPQRKFVFCFAPERKLTALQKALVITRYFEKEGYLDVQYEGRFFQLPLPSVVPFLGVQGHIRCNYPTEPERDYLTANLLRVLYLYVANGKVRYCDMNIQGERIIPLFGFRIWRENNEVRPLKIIGAIRAIGWKSPFSQVRIVPVSHRQMRAILSAGDFDLAMIDYSLEDTSIQEVIDVLALLFNFGIPYEIYEISDVEQGK